MSDNTGFLGISRCKTEACNWSTAGQTYRTLGIQDFDFAPEYLAVARDLRFTRAGYDRSLWDITQLAISDLGDDFARFPTPLAWADMCEACGGSSYGHGKVDVNRVS